MAFQFEWKKTVQILNNSCPRIEQQKRKKKKMTVQFGWTVAVQRLNNNYPRIEQQK